MESSEDEYNTDNERNRKAVMERRKQKKTYQHKYRAEWEKMEDFKNWISPSKKGINLFYCKVCKEDYIGGLSAVRKHALSQKHFKLSKTLQNQSKLTIVNTSSTKNIKMVEIRLGMFIAEHNLSFNLADSLVDLVKSISKNLDKNDIQNIKCNRTKCTKIVTNVIGQTDFELVLYNIKNNPFSVLVDESTDVSCQKTLAVVVRNISDNTVKDQFLKLLEVKDGTAQGLYTLLVDFFVNYNVPYKENLIGFASDGCNTMMGQHHSLQSLLKEDVNDLFVLLCICHSLALVASYACKKLPDNIEYLLRDMYSYLQSSKRLNEYTEFQNFLNIKPHKILQSSQTRWLSLNSVVNRVLEQFNALKLFFQSQHLQERDKKAEQIFGVLNDPLTKLYLQFLQYVLPFTVHLNQEFQSEQPKIHTLHERMATVYKTFLEFYLNPEYIKNTPLENIQYRNPVNFMDINNMYFGAEVMIALSTNCNNTLRKEDIHNFKLRCLDFYIECCHQIYKRFPFNQEHIKSLKLLSFLEPKNIPGIQSIAVTASKFPNLSKSVSISDLDREYRLMRNMENINFDQDFMTFWTHIFTLKQNDNTEYFPNLSIFVKKILCLPHSSATVERIFSSINLNKTKIRNRLCNETIEGILHSKNILKVQKKTSVDFEINNDMFSKHNISMY